ETQVSERHADVDPRPPPVPRFALGAGPYVAGRSMAFAHGDGGTGELPSYPGHTAFGARLHANAYPLSRVRTRSGPGVTLDAAKSVAWNSAGGYTLSQLAGELGLHYGWPLASLTIDFAVDGGSVANKLVDRPASVAIPTTSYSYLGGGVDVDFT